MLRTSNKKRAIFKIIVEATLGKLYLHSSRLLALIFYLSFRNNRSGYISIFIPCSTAATGYLVRAIAARDPASPLAQPAGKPPQSWQAPYRYFLCRGDYKVALAEVVVGLAQLASHCGKSTNPLTYSETGADLTFSRTVAAKAPLSPQLAANPGEQGARRARHGAHKRAGRLQAPALIATALTAVPERLLERLSL